MSGSNNDDFWNSSSDDDFWNKPVAGDDWLKEEENSFWSNGQSENTVNPYLNTEKKTDFSGLSKEFLKEEKPRENPYWEKENAKPHKEEKKVKAQGEKKKRVHVRTIICLSFIVIALLSVVTAVILAKMTQAKALTAALKLSYQEEAVTGEFQFNENNRIYLEDEAYTIVTGESFQGFPTGIKLIAVYAEVESDTYIRDSYVMRDMYIGFEENGGEAYKQPVGNDMISAYVYGYGFDDDQVLSIYGIGNGSDYAGYFFFFVPEEVEKITVYVEKKAAKDKIPVIDTVYSKEMAVLPEDEGLTEELTERKVWW